jgi:hypothetical protein
LIGIFNLQRGEGMIKKPFPCEEERVWGEGGRTIIEHPPLFKVANPG